MAKEEGATKLNSMRIIRQTENCYEYCVTKCMFFEFYNYMNTPELTKIMCSADNAIFNTYLPNEIVFERGIGKTMPEGAKEWLKYIENARPMGYNFFKSSYLNEEET